MKTSVSIALAVWVTRGKTQIFVFSEICTRSDLYSKHGTFLCHKYGEGEAVVKQPALSYICKYLFGISVYLERIQYFLFLLTGACNTLIALFHDSNSCFFSYSLSDYPYKPRRNMIGAP